MISVSFFDEIEGRDFFFGDPGFDEGAELLSSLHRARSKGDAEARVLRILMELLDLSVKIEFVP